jgi:acyl transferase domain-containing protein
MHKIARRIQATPPAHGSYGRSQPARAGCRAGHRTSDLRTGNPPAAQYAAVEEGADTGLAVIGIDCRFPGAKDWRSFWCRLCEQYDGIVSVPAERRGSLYSMPDQSVPSGWMRRGGFIEEAFAFDSSFFSISPRESELMDPQQRLLLQSVWNAVEDAGYAMNDFSKRFRVGTFVGMSAMDFLWHVSSHGLPASPQLLTGSAHSIAANRIAFTFDFHGPSEAVDTACSSALVALHRARQAIASGDCDCAIIAACNLLVSPLVHACFGQAGMLSNEGVCRTFDRSAGGYVRSEGVGAVVIKPLRQALADNDAIYGLIRGTAVNHSGRSRTLTSPSAFAQSSVIRAALEAAGLSSATISYVETHGTATPKGDPVEVLGLKRAFARKSGVRCGLGAVKTNIGHLEPAAGLAGLIKVLLCLRHRKLPGLAHFQQLNPLIDLDDTPFYLVERTMPWERPVLNGETLPRRAGLSSFGFGGTNAHAVLEEYAPPTAATAGTGAPLCILPLSAPTTTGLAARALRLADFLASEEGAGVRLADAAFTLQAGREAFPERLAVLAAEPASAAAALREFATRNAKGGTRLCASDSTAEAGPGQALRQTAQDWLDGLPADWNANGRRVPMPTYEFSKTHYPLPPPPRARTRLHAWIDENVSTFGRQRFSKRLDSTPPLLSEGGIDGRPSLPLGPALEMLFQAAVLSLGRARVGGLKSVEWVCPLTLEKPTEVFVEIESSGIGFSCKLIGDAASGHRLYARAEVLPAAEPVAAAMPVRLDPGMASEGRDRHLDNADSVNLASGGTAVRFDLPQSEQGEALVFPATLIDKLLNTVGLMAHIPQCPAPKALIMARVVDAAPASGIAHLRLRTETRAGGPLWDIECLNEKGRLWLSLDGLSLGDTDAPSPPAKPPLWAEAAPQARIGDVQVASAVVTGQEPPLRQRLHAYLAAVIAGVTKLPPEQIDITQGFDRYGLDSALIVEATQAVEQVCGPVPQTLFFEHTTLESLAEYLLAQHTPALSAYFADQGSLGGEDSSDSQVHRSTEQAALPDAPAMGASPGTQEPIAIIGIAGRYPRSATLEDFWRNLSLGLDLVTAIPADRWRISEHFCPKKGTPGKTYCKWGSFIDEPARFDAALFNIPPTEARVLDPQERQFLEIAWATFEDAGYSRAGLAGQSVGVFVGAMWAQYQMVETCAGSEWLPNSSFSSIANRVSYIFDLSGPSVAVDTMCASSLTSIHLACRSLRQGDCRMALAGGVNLSLHVNKYLQLAQSRFLASDGRCKSFGEGGDGYVPGEGVGAVLLKPLSDALRDGDFIHAVIRGTAANHCGRTHGYTVPNPRAQADVVRAALADAGLGPRQISYVEAHGTGTSLGDPIEISGLREVFARHEPCAPPLPIGSVKSNLGHLEAAAGIAGLTKVVLQLRHGQLAPSIHSERLNPAIDFAGCGFVVQHELTEWPPDEGMKPRRAGISSFGAGGSNAHVVLEELVPAARAGSGIDAACRAGLWLPLSALHREQLIRRALDLKGFLLRQWPRLRMRHGLTLADIAWTLRVGREPLPFRAAVFAAGEEELIMRLSALASGSRDAGVVVGEKPVPIRASAGSGAPAALAEDAAAMAAAWADGRGAFPPVPVPTDIRLRRVPLPALSFMGAAHWIADAPPSKTVREHGLFRNLTVVQT